MTSTYSLRSPTAAMLHRVLLAASLLSLCSCGGNKAGVVATKKAPASTDWIAPSARPVELSVEMQRLVRAIEQLAVTRDDRSHADLVRALRALAEGVRALGPASDHHAMLVEEAAAQLQRSKTGDRTHADHVRTALDHALAALQDAQQDPVEESQRSAYVASLRAWKTLDGDQPLMRQHAQVHLALVTITNALAVARGMAPPFVGVGDAAMVHRPDLDTFVAQTRRADELASAVATASSWTSARMKTAETLQALAEAVVAAPAVTVDAGAHATVIGFEATRLERASTLDDRRVDWTKTALLGAVTALETMVPNTPIVASLSATAARAVDAIDPRATFAFQRPAIQDALRAVVGAYRAVAVHEQQTRRQAAR